MVRNKSLAKSAINNLGQNANRLTIHYQAILKIFKANRTNKISYRIKIQKIYIRVMSRRSKPIYLEKLVEALKRENEAVDQQLLLSVLLDILVQKGHNRLELGQAKMILFSIKNEQFLKVKTIKEKTMIQREFNQFVQQDNSLINKIAIMISLVLIAIISIALIMEISNSSNSRMTILLLGKIPQMMYKKNTTLCKYKAQSMLKTLPNYHPISAEDQVLKLTR